MFALGNFAAVLRNKLRRADGSADDDDDSSFFRWPIAPPNAVRRRIEVGNISRCRAATPNPTNELAMVHFDAESLTEYFGNDLVGV